MDYITNEDGGDGFGSQILAKISGVVYADYHKLNYVHFPIKTILLEDNPTESRNSELENANNIIDIVMQNLGIKNINELDRSDNINARNRVDFYNEINSNPDQYFTESLLEKFKNSYKQDPPDFYQNGKLNIAIHIRRGNDISVNDPLRYISSDVYDNVINILLEKYENSIIHIFSWNDPQITTKSDRIIYHITEDGGKEFISDFNALVYSDILLVGSSTFSISAGFFNKNKVLYNKKITRMEINPYPRIWEKNFDDIVGEF